MDTDRLARLFVEMADTLVEDFDVLDLFHTLVSGCVELLDASVVGLSLGETIDDLHLVASSDHAAAPLGLLQVQTEQGPAADCYRSGDPVEVGSVGEYADRWPQFTAEAVAGGYESVLALPMRLRGEVIGVLALLGPAALAPVHSRDRVVAQALADAATIAILQNREAQTSELLTEQLEGALSSRIVIEQAKGVLSAALGIGVDEAFARLRQHARNSRRRLTEVAQEVLVSDCSAFAVSGQERARLTRHRG